MFLCVLQTFKSKLNVLLITQLETWINYKSATKRVFCHKNVNYQGVLTSLLALCIPSWGQGVCPLSPLNDGNIKHSQNVVVLLSSFISKWSSWRPTFINHGRAPAVRESLAWLQQPGLQIVSEWRWARPLQPPFVTVSWQMLFDCLSQTHASFLPSALCFQMACFTLSRGSLWAAWSPWLLEVQHQIELHHSYVLYSILFSHWFKKEIIVKKVYRVFSVKILILN